MLEKVINLIAAAYKIDPSTLSRDTDFQKDLALDSLSLVQSIVEIEEMFDVEIPEKKLLRMHSIGDLVDFLEQATLK